MRAMLSIMGLYNYDNTVMDNFRVPTGLDRETAINKILFDNAELGLVYTDPDIFPHLVKNWTDSNFSNWERMLTALTEEYNPTHNYDRYETWEDNTEGNTSGTSERDVAGFNENATLVKEAAISNNDETSVSGNHEGHMYGNIGVTTAMSMVKEELELRKNYNIYQEISDSFKRNFCVMVY